MNDVDEVGAGSLSVARGGRGGCCYLQIERGNAPKYGCVLSSEMMHRRISLFSSTLEVLIFDANEH